MKNKKGLGWRQKAMLQFIERNVERYCDPTRTFSIHQDEKATALSLEKRGLIKIVNDGWDRWQVRMA